MSINPAQTFISTGITLPSASEADWILLMMSFTSFDYAEWIWIRLQDILDLTASEVDDTPRISTDVNDFMVIPHPLVSDNSDILLGRTSTNVLLIGTYQASVTFAGITVTLRRVSESTNGGGGGGSGEDTDITIERDADSVDVQSSTGGDGTIPAADTDSAGVMTADQFDKLESVEENAKDDQTGAEIKTAYEDEDDTNTFTDDEKSKLGSVPDTDITSPILIFARSSTEPHHPTGAVSDTGVLSLDGEWDRFIPLAVGGSRSGTISLRTNNENPTGVARHGGETYVANDGPTTNDKRFFVYNASGLPIALYNLHGDNEDPQAVTITPDGNVFIADGAGEEFFQYTTAGVYVNRHSFPSGANITGAGSDENYLYFLNSSIRQVYVYFHGGGANPSRNRTLPFTGTHNFRGYTFANGRDYVLNSTGSDHEILVYRNGIRLTSEEQDLDSDNAAARGLGIDGSRFFVADSSDNIIYIYGDEDVNENPLFVAEAYVNLTDNTVTFSEFFQVDVSRFNLYDDVENELDALAENDRFLVVDYSADGRPNRYIDYSDLRDALRTEIEFNLHDDVDTELTSPANDDRMLIADESETGNPQRFIRYQTAKDDIRPSVEGDGSTVVSSPTHINVTGDGATVTADGDGVQVDIPQGAVAVDDTTIEEDATDGLRVKSGGIDTDQLADDAVDGDKLGEGVVDDTHIHSTISAQGKVNFRAKIESDKVLEGTGISIADSNNQKEISVENPFTEEDEILLGEVASNSGGHLSHGDLILRSQYASEHFFGDSRRRVQGMTHDGDAPFVIDGTGRINDQDTLVGNDDVYGLATNNQNWYVGSNDGNLVHVYRRNTDETFSQSSPGSTSTVAARSLAIDPDDGTICYQFRLPGSGIEIRSHIISETVGNGQFDPEVTRTISLADINAVLNNNDVESLQSEITINGNVGITAIGASGGFIYIVCSGVYIENQRSSASAVIRAEITGTGSSRDYTLDDDYLQLINVPNGISAIVPVDEGFWVARSYSVLDYREGVINSTDLGDFPDAPVEADDGKVPTYTHEDENYQLKFIRDEQVADDLSDPEKETFRDRIDASKKLGCLIFYGVNQARRLERQSAVSTANVLMEFQTDPSEPKTTNPLRGDTSDVIWMVDADISDNIDISGTIPDGVVFSLEEGTWHVRFRGNTRILNEDNFNVILAKIALDDDISLGSGSWEGGMATSDRLYFVNNSTDMAVAYDHSGNRQSSDDISLGSGIWEGGMATSDRLYFVNDSTNMAVAYDHSGNRQSSDDISLGSGIWESSVATSDRLYFVNDSTDMAVAYDHSGNRQSSDDISLGSGSWESSVATSDRLYFVNDSTDMAVAYDHSGNRQSSDDISLGSGSWEGGMATSDRLYFVNDSTDMAVAYDHNFIRVNRDEIIDIDFASETPTVLDEHEGSQVKVDIEYLETDGTEEFYIYLRGFQNVDAQRFIGGYLQLERVV